jgi:hypothetical protein
MPLTSSTYRDCDAQVSVTGGSTAPRQWNKYGDQQLSTRVQLHAGKHLDPHAVPCYRLAR